MNRTVLFQDVDASGMVPAARVFEYFHDAFARHLAAHGIDLARIVRERTWGAPIGHAEVDAAAPLRHGDSIVVEIERGEIGRASLTVFYRVRAATDETRVFCTGKTTHVFVDLATFTPRPVPEDVRAAFAIGT